MLKCWCQRRGGFSSNSGVHFPKLFWNCKPLVFGMSFLPMTNSLLPWARNRKTFLGLYHWWIIKTLVWSILSNHPLHQPQWDLELTFQTFFLQEGYAVMMCLNLLSGIFSTGWKSLDSFHQSKQVCVYNSSVDYNIFQFIIPHLTVALLLPPLQGCSYLCPHLTSQGLAWTTYLLKESFMEVCRTFGT